MSVNNLVRSASRFVPWVSMRGRGRCWWSHRHYTSATVPRSFPSFIHRYCTQIYSDESLLTTVEDEIHCANESLPITEEGGENGFPFKIEDCAGTETIMLTREYKGEAISVEVHMPNLVTGDDEDEDENQSSIPLIVKTSKGSGPYLEFGCTAYPDELVIDSLSVKHPHNSEDQIAYEGPDFADLDENLQKALHRYLEVRGIKPSTTNYFHGYMIDKETREYVGWLKKIDKFLRA